MNDKDKVLGNVSNLSFGTVFKATCAFYLAQLVLGLCFIGAIAGSIFLYVLFK